MAAAVERAPYVGRMSCRRARRLAAAYVDGVLDEKLRPALECHLFTCEACYRAYRALVDVRETLGVAAAGAYEPAPELREQVHAAVAAAASAAVRPVRRAAVNWGVAAAAAAVVLALVGGLWLATKRGPAAGTETTQAVRVAAAPAGAARVNVSPARPRAQGTSEVKAVRPQTAIRGMRPAQRRGNGVRRGRKPRRHPTATTAERLTRPKPMPAEEEASGRSAPVANVAEGAAVAEILPAVEAAEPAIVAEAVGRPTVAPPTVAGSMSLHAAEPEALAAAAAPPARGRGEPAPATESKATQPQPSSIARQPAAPPAPAGGGGAQFAEAAVGPAEHVGATGQPEGAAAEAVRVAQAPERPAMHWLPVRSAPTTQVIAAAGDARSQLDELRRRLNERLREDDLAARKGWIVIK